MQLQVGMVIEGKVTGITKFGAFVALPEGKSGLVHISEIANTFVNDVHDYVQDGQTVKVKIIGIGDDGKINLSIKKADEHAPQQRQDQRPPRPASAAQPRQYGGPRQAVPRANGPTGDVSFEDKLKQFMQESDSRMADNKMYSDHRTSRRRR
ncbi:MAG: S1 RNA-binding domain-containing protein [Oscillospiraceae bacterium]|nr:S1 RNA-binding domain-containing protein [Bacillota bacterium]